MIDHGDEWSPEYNAANNGAIVLAQRVSSKKVSKAFAEELFDAYAHSLLPDTAKDGCRRITYQPDE